MITPAPVTPAPRITVDTHIHTVASGHAFSTVTENAREAASRGLAMIANTDHGPDLPGGTNKIYFKGQRVIPRFIAGVAVLRGIEANIRHGRGTDCTESMEAALQVLFDTKGTGEKPRRFAVLGDMLELGNHSSGEHHRIGRVAAYKADFLLTYGEQSWHTLQGALTGGMSQRNAMNFHSQEELLNVLKNRARPGDVLLFKGSHGMHMENILKEFMQED